MNKAKTSKSPVVGVVCELNPLHNGHVYLLSEAKRLAGDEGLVVCVMSGKSTQRGECAIASPFVRGRMALCGGADLVVELPFPWSSGSAEAFADAGVHILAALGADHLIFGSECGDMTLLSKGAELMGAVDFSETYAALFRQGKGTAAAYTETIRRLADTRGWKLPEGFPSSNDLLGLAYLSAIRRLSVSMCAHTVKRLGQDFRDELLTDVSYPSATALRRLIHEAADDPVCLAAVLKDTMPDEALEILLQEIAENTAPTDDTPLWAYYHTYFRLYHPATAEVTAEVGGGLASHLHKCALAADTPAAFMKEAETKQYTRARLRRSLLFAVTGVTDTDLHIMPAYTRLLAANERGRTYLKARRKCEDPTFSVVTKPADAPEGRQRFLDEQMDRLFTLCLPTPKEAGWLVRQGAYIKP